LGELALALFHPMSDVQIQVRDDFFIRFDPEIGWVNRENSEGVHSPNPSGPGGHVRTNSRGLRGGEVPYERTPGRNRILVLGDSVTFGYGLEEEDSYPALLGKRLGGGAEVLNAGVVGYGLDQQYLWFKREGVRYRPDVVVVGFSAGDIYDSTCSMRYGSYKPFFRFAAGRLLLMNSPVPEKVSINILLERSLGPAGRFLFRHSRIYRLLFLRLTDPGKMLRELDTPEMNTLEGMRLAAAIIREMKVLCDGAGCRLVFLVIPQEDWLLASGRPEGRFLRRGHDAAVQVLNEAGVPHLDLWEALGRRIEEGLFQKGDFVHTNSRGNRVIAEAILRSGLL
jgi:lysophospholipase L1-like esterase